MDNWRKIAEIQEQEFKIAHDMTVAVATGELRGLVLSGSPGLGKSYTTYRALEQADGMHRERMPFRPLTRRWSADGRWNPTFQIIKTKVTPPALHSALHRMSWRYETTLLDDCDSVFRSEESLNILKSALDTSEKRIVSWVTAKKPPNDAPVEYDMQGGIIMITNIDFDEIRNPKLREHIDALEDRVYKIKFSLSTLEEKFARIRSLIEDHGFLNNLVACPMDIYKYMVENQAAFDEISLRTALKVADLMRLWPDRWETMVRGTLFKKS